VPRASFITDVTIPDNSVLQPGASFNKTWRVRNSGGCRWSNGYALVFTSGNRLEGASPLHLPGIVEPGASVDITARLKAPATTGTYRGEWMLYTDGGVVFGVGEAGLSPIWVQIVVGPAGGGSGAAQWKGEYFANRKLKGSPALVRTDRAIDFDWGRNPPAEGLPADDFSVRWSSRVEFEAGTYRIRILVDDGVRLYVDDQLALDEWEDGGARELSTEVALAKGTHSLRLEYYEHTREARIRLRWQRQSDPEFLDWKGRYFANRKLEGEPALIRNDRAVDFAWGTSSPAVGVPADDFSARWTRKLAFEGGVYKFNARADDGIRVYLDDELILDEWHDSSGDDAYSVTRTLLAGEHRLKVEYYERWGRAMVKVWWERLAPTATPTATSSPSPTPTATSSPTPTATVTAGAEPPSPTPTATSTILPPSPTPTSTPSMTATPTETATATSTGVASSIPGAQVVYDFAGGVWAQPRIVR
jgi:hypothetical protein